MSINHLHLITLTGADERTDIDALVTLVRSNPLVEVGLLYTATPEGRPRYPSRSWLLETSLALSGRCAIHVCGGMARRQLLEGGLSELIRHAPRIQVNGKLTVEEVEAACRIADTVITQHHEGNMGLLSVRASNHQVLMDASGGRGITPQSWSPPLTNKAVGFAGGLGPDTLAEKLPRIGMVAREGAWVDMEERLRVDDWFSVGLAVQCAAIFAAATTTPTPTAQYRFKP